MGKQINISDEARVMLDKLCEIEKRGITHEVEFLFENRLKELGFQAETDFPTVDNNDCSKAKCNCQ